MRAYAKPRIHLSNTFERGQNNKDLHVQLSALTVLINIF